MQKLAFEILTYFLSIYKAISIWSARGLKNICILIDWV